MQCSVDTLAANRGFTFGDHLWALLKPTRALVRASLLGNDAAARPQAQIKSTHGWHEWHTWLEHPASNHCSEYPDRRATGTLRMFCLQCMHAKNWQRRVNAQSTTQRPLQARRPHSPSNHISSNTSRRKSCRTSKRILDCTLPTRYLQMKSNLSERDSFLQSGRDFPASALGPNPAH